MEHILINQNEVRLVKPLTENSDTFNVLSEVKHIKTKDFYDRLYASNNIQSDILPRNCRFYKQIENYTYLIIEEPPAIRNICVDLQFDTVIENLRRTGRLKEYGYSDFLKNKPPYYFNLSFPYVVFFLAFLDDCPKELRVFFRLHPMSSFHDYLLHANFTNLDSNGHVCLGPNNAKNTNLSLGEKVEELINAFWANQFNGDITYVYNMYNDVPEVSSFLHWEYNTSIDPMFIFSTKWKTFNFNIISEIQDLTRNFNGGDRSNIDNAGAYLFKDTIDMICNIPSVKLDPKTVTSHCQSHYFTDEHALGIGDEIVINDEKHYIYEFLGTIKIDPATKQSFIDSSTISGVMLENSKGEFVKYKISDSSLLSAIKNTYNKENILTEYELNGIIYKIGDIICIDKNSEVKEFKKIEKIRSNRRGKIEFLIGTDYYILESLKNIEIINPEDLTINNINFKKGNLYVDKGKSRTRASIIFGNAIITFEKAEIIRGIFYLQFKLGENLYHIKHSDIDNRIAPHVENERENLSIFSYGNTIIINDLKESICQITNDHKLYITNNNIILMIKNSRNNDSIIMEQRLDIVKSEILKDNNSIQLKGLCFNIDFKIGDNIIYVDWDNPPEMFIHRNITGFNFCKETFKMYIDTVDCKGNIKSIEYIDFRSMIISVEKVRKCVTNLNGISVGDKIVTVNKIPLFLKKDTHLVMAILVDTDKYPLILTSNYSAIWMEEENLKNFKFVNREDPVYKKLKVTIFENTDHIKFQPGDIIIDKNNIRELVLTKQESIDIQSALCDSYTYATQNISSKKLSGICTQRFIESNAKAPSTYTYVLPNFLSGFIPIDYLPRIYRKDWRFFNV
jgi:hypothetical protein